MFVNVFKFINDNKLKYILSILLLLIVISEGTAQVQLQSYFDVGSNNTSDGAFIKNGYRGNYQYKKYSVETGLQFDWLSNNPNTLTGFDIVGTREFSIKDFPFELNGFYMLNRFSDLAHENNWGLTIETRKLKHFAFALGTNFKSYKINSDALEEYNISKSNSKLEENWNLMYLVTAYLKPHTYHWNIGLSCTNIDYYIINQSTNPVFNLQGLYKPKSNLTLFMEAWYKQAGMLNINANYFGYFVRGGIKWEI